MLEKFQLLLYELNIITDNYQVIYLDSSKDITCTHCIICKKEFAVCIKQNECIFQQNTVICFVELAITFKLIYGLFARYSSYKVYLFFINYIKHKILQDPLEKENPFFLFEHHVLKIKPLGLKDKITHLNNINAKKKVIFIFFPNKTTINPDNL